MQTSGRALGLLLLVAALAGCRKEHGTETGPSFPAETIRVYTDIRDRVAESQPGDEHLRACLVFWREESYREILDGEWPQHEPYLAVRPEETIDYYRVANGIPYNTERSYPPGGQHLHVVGFAPAELTSEDYYHTLEIPGHLQTGKVDFLSGDGNNRRMGTVEEPFVKKPAEGESVQEVLQRNKERQLEFCHLTAKIRFEAKRAESMANRIGVRNVKVKLLEQSVPTRLEWQPIPDIEEGGGYFPVEVKGLDTIYLAAFKDEPVMAEGCQAVDSCYVYAPGDHYRPGQAGGESGEITLRMDIEAELMPYDEETGDWDISQLSKRIWKNQTVTIDSKTGGALKMGYSYTVTITFDVNDLRLQGMEMPWERGGNTYVPITPVEAPETPENGNKEGGKR